MTDTQGLYACLLVAAAICVWCLRRAVSEYRAELSAPEPVDRALWEPNAPLWTETYDRLAAENLRAELDDDEAVARRIEATS